MRSSRRLVALAFVASSSALLALWGCSTPDSHPPALGECSGSLCPPAQGQGISAGSSGAADSGALDSGSGGPIDSGGIVDDSGAADTGSPVDSGAGD